MIDDFQSPFYLFYEDFLDGNELQDETESSNFDTSASSTSVLVLEDLVDSSKFEDRFLDYLDRFNDIFSFESVSNLDQAKIDEIRDFLLGDVGDIFVEFNRDFITDTEFQISNDFVGEGSGGNILLDSEVIDITDSGVDIITDFEIEIDRIDFINFSNSLTFNTLVDTEAFSSTEDPLEDFISFPDNFSFDESESFAFPDI